MRRTLSQIKTLHLIGANEIKSPTAQLFLRLNYLYQIRPNEQ